MLYEKVIQEHQKLQSKIDAISSELEKLPSGKLICTRNGKQTKWYQSDGHTSQYIPKKNRKLAEELAIKKYLTCMTNDLCHEKHALELYLKHCVKNIDKADKLLTEPSGYQELLAPYFHPKSQRLQEWTNAFYEQNLKYPDQLIHKTSSGIFVRSKSEAMIDLHLHTNHIPFRYECALHLGETTIFPDFTILHPATEEIYYWEHFGKMDDPSYHKNVFLKLQLYTSYKIIPSINLITTYETQASPLTSDIIEKIIQYYFL